MNVLSGLQSEKSAMKAVHAMEYGGREVIRFIRHAPLPLPGPSDLLVRNVFASVNFHDTYCRSGLYKNPTWGSGMYRKGIGFTLGLEGAGFIESAPEGSGFKVGDQVAYIHPHCGSYAEFTAVPSGSATPIPSDIPLQTAAALLVGGTTAQFLVDDAVAPALEEGDLVVVHAAAGATGNLILRYAKRRGLRVLATASTLKKRNMALQAGADFVCGYDDFEAEVARMVAPAATAAPPPTSRPPPFLLQDRGAGGAAAVFDGVGTPTLGPGLRCLRPRGSMVLYGQAGGAPGRVVDPLADLGRGSLRLTRPTLFDYVNGAGGERFTLRARAGVVWNLVRNGTFPFPFGEKEAEGDKKAKAAISTAVVLPLSQAQEAHRLLESRDSTRGKLLLRL